jgi:hypothetical protein
VVKLAGAVVVCAVAAFAVAFYAAGAGKAPARHITHHTPVPFADTAASSVSFSGIPAALKLPPPPPKHVKHHAKPAASVTAPTASTAAPATSTPSVAPTVHVSSPPVKHKSSGVTGTGTGTTVVGP